MFHVQAPFFRLVAAMGQHREFVEDLSQEMYEDAKNQAKEIARNHDSQDPQANWSFFNPPIPCNQFLFKNSNYILE